MAGKKFSDGFVHDMVDLIERCMKSKTDTCDLRFWCPSGMLNIHIVFSACIGRKESNESISRM